jgi:hypothetical protein
MWREYIPEREMISRIDALAPGNGAPEAPVRSMLRPHQGELGLAERTEFDDLARLDFTDLPRDGLWVTCITYLAEVCAFLGGADRAIISYQLLLLYARQNIEALASACRLRMRGLQDPNAACTHSLETPP